MFLLPIAGTACLSIVIRINFMSLRHPDPILEMLPLYIASEGVSLNPNPGRDEWSWIKKQAWLDILDIVQIFKIIPN